LSLPYEVTNSSIEVLYLQSGINVTTSAALRLEEPGELSEPVSLVSKLNGIEIETCPVDSSES